MRIFKKAKIRPLKNQLMGMRRLATELGVIDEEAQKAWDRLDVEQALFLEKAASSLVSDRHKLAHDMADIEYALHEDGVPDPDPRWILPPWLKKETEIIAGEILAGILGYGYESFVHYCAGLELKTEGRFADSVEEFSEAIEIDQEMFEAYLGRAEAYWEMGEFEKAIDDLDMARAISPDSSDIYQRRGIVYANMGNFQMALEDLNQAIVLDQDNASAYSCRGNVHDEMGEYQQALDDYNKALKLNPDSAMTYNNRGHAYHTHGEYDMALRDYDMALRMDPYLDRVYYNRADLYKKMGLDILARQDNETAEAMENVLWPGDNEDNAAV